MNEDNNDLNLPPVHDETSQRLSEMGYKPFGGPFDPNQIATPITLPSSIFSSVILAPLLIDKDQRRDRHYITTLIVPQILTYTACVAVQGGFLFFVRTLVSEMTPPVCTGGGDSTLRILCMILNVAAVLNDIRETISMHVWLRCIPKWTSDQTTIVEYTCHNSGRTSFPFQKYKEEDGDGIELVKPAVGLTRTVRCFIYVLVLFVRFTFAIWLLVYGTVFVASAANNETLILNSVVLIFILTIDDLLYDLMTPDLYKNWIKTCSVITFDEDESDNIVILCWPYFVLMFLGAATSILYGHWCLAW